MAIDLMKFLARFIEEAREHINSLNQGLLNLEKNPDDSETLNSIFRAAHTLKGSSRMMKLTPIGEVAHKLEEVLDGLRSGKIKLSKDLSDLLFNAIDILAEMVETTAGGAPLKDDSQAIRTALERAAGEEVLPRGNAGEPGPPSPIAGSEGFTAKADPGDSAPAPKSEAGQVQDGKPAAAKGFDNTIRINTEKLDGLIKLAGEMVSSHGLLKQRLIEIRKMEKLARGCVALSTHLENGKAASARGEVVKSIHSLHRSLKQLVFNVTEDVSFQEHLTLDLQENALSMRMLPISTLFDSFRRVVRDLSTSLEKKIHFITEGGETELDKKMIEKIGDPIIHMIRNAIDHGIEKPRDRLEASKPEEGALRLSACYEGESVLIELSDDGAGISLGKIKEKCRQKRLFDESVLNSLPESEIGRASCRERV